MSAQTLRLPLVLPAGDECDLCIARLQSELSRLKGVSSAAVNNARTTVTLNFDPDVITLSRIESEARQVGAGLAARIDHQTLELRDLDCPDCAITIERAVNKLPGVLWAGANFAAGRIHVEFERGRTTLPEIRKVVESHGVRACPVSPPSDDARREPEERESGWLAWLRDHRKAATAAATALLTLTAVLASALGRHRESNLLYAAAVAAGGWSTAQAGLMALRTRSTDMNVLMTLAVLGAAAIGDWFEAATVVALYNAGTLLQAYSVDRTRRSIRALMDLSPRRALVRRGRGEFDVPVEQVRLYETVIVKPGERIPMDGEVTLGASAVNEAAITGESLPVEKVPGSHVFAGSLNGDGALELRVDHVYRDTLLARIIHRVEEAQAQRAPAQQLIDQFARRYTPLVVLLAVAIAFVPPLSLTAWYAYHSASLMPHVWSNWFLRGLSLLIIACPCALVISTPVAIVTAIGAASRAGALIKGGTYLEEMGRVRAILFDKTGTLTEGRFRVEDVVPVNGASCAEILRTAAAIESRSEHPLASAFREAAAGSNGSLPEVERFQALPGRGARAVVDGVEWHVGGAGMLGELGIPRDAVQPHLDRVEGLGKTAVIVVRDLEPIGLVVVSDTPREGARAAIAELERLGITQQAMLTGDNLHAARSVAAGAGLREFKAGLLPEQKLEIVRVYQQLYGPVAMVGDGFNDAPALATANVGIVMGAAGSDTAIETADIALMGDDLSRIPFLVRLSRRTRAIVRQNVAFSLATKGALISLAIFPGLPLWLAVLGDVGVSLLVTTNALRLTRTT